MFRRASVLRTLSIVSVALPLALSTAACGPKQEGPKVANVAPGDMPAGGDWTGVYYSQTYGYLHLVKEGDTISGRWRNDAGDKWGEMSGKVTGDLYKFEWTEHTIGMVGPSATSKGRGYFKYTAPNEGEAHELKGGWGLGTSETGNKWEAVKQQNMQPDLKSVMPDEFERRGVGGGWDDGQQPPPQQGGGDQGGGDQGGGGESGGDEGGGDPIEGQ